MGTVEGWTSPRTVTVYFLAPTLGRLQQAVTMTAAGLGEEVWMDATAQCSAGATTMGADSPALAQTLEVA